MMSSLKFNSLTTIRTAGKFEVILRSLSKQPLTQVVALSANHSLNPNAKISSNSARPRRMPRNALIA